MRKVLTTVHCPAEAVEHLSPAESLHCLLKPALFFFFLQVSSSFSVYFCLGPLQGQFSWDEGALAQGS